MQGKTKQAARSEDINWAGQSIPAATTTQKRRWVCYIRKPKGDGGRIHPGPFTQDASHMMPIIPREERNAPLEDPSLGLPHKAH